MTAPAKRRTPSGPHDRQPRIGQPANGLKRSRRDGRTTGTKGKRRGAVMVEFALVAPVFFLVVLGMIEFGRMLMVQQILTNASREGVRRAVVEGVTQTEVTTLVTTYLTNASVSGATVTVTPSSLASLGFGDSVTVAVTVPYDGISWTSSPWFLSGTTLFASTMMQAERLQ